MKPIRQTFAGRSSFPVDMLRYDNCYPVSELDSNTIASSLRARGFGNDGHEFQVTVETTSRFEFTLARWESFGWKPVNLESQHA
jgi:hypothetical protein